MPRSQRLRAGGVQPTKACASPLALTAAAQNVHTVWPFSPALPPRPTLRVLCRLTAAHTLLTRVLCPSSRSAWSVLPKSGAVVHACVINFRSQIPCG